MIARYGTPETTQTRMNMERKAPTPEQIKEYRKKAELTQAEAAKLIETSLRTWQGWERKSRPYRMSAGNWIAFQERVRAKLKKGRKGRK